MLDSEGNVLKDFAENPFKITNKISKNIWKKMISYIMNDENSETI